MIPLLQTINKQILDSLVIEFKKIIVNDTQNLDKLKAELHSFFSKNEKITENYNSLFYFASAAFKCIRQANNPLIGIIFADHVAKSVEYSYDFFHSPFHHELYLQLKLYLESQLSGCSTYIFDMQKQLMTKIYNDYYKKILNVLYAEVTSSDKKALDYLQLMVIYFEYMLMSSDYIQAKKIANNLHHTLILKHNRNLSTIKDFEDKATDVFKATFARLVTFTINSCKILEQIDTDLKVIKDRGVKIALHNKTLIEQCFDKVQLILTLFDNFISYFKNEQYIFTISNFDKVIIDACYIKILYSYTLCANFFIDAIQASRIKYEIKTYASKFVRIMCLHKSLKISSSDKAKLAHTAIMLSVLTKFFFPKNSISLRFLEIHNEILKQDDALYPLNDSNYASKIHEISQFSQKKLALSNCFNIFYKNCALNTTFITLCSENVTKKISTRVKQGNLDDYNNKNTGFNLEVLKQDYADLFKLYQKCKNLPKKPEFDQQYELCKNRLVANLSNFIANESSLVKPKIAESFLNLINKYKVFTEAIAKNTEYNIYARELEDIYDLIHAFHKIAIKYSDSKVSIKQSSEGIALLKKNLSELVNLTTKKLSIEGILKLIDKFFETNSALLKNIEDPFENLIKLFLQLHPINKYTINKTKTELIKYLNKLLIRIAFIDEIKAHEKFPDFNFTDTINLILKKSIIEYQNTLAKLDYYSQNNLAYVLSVADLCNFNTRDMLKIYKQAYIKQINNIDFDKANKSLIYYELKLNDNINSSLSGMVYKLSIDMADATYKAFLKYLPHVNKYFEVNITKQTNPTIITKINDRLQQNSHIADGFFMLIFKLHLSYRQEYVGFDKIFLTITEGYIVTKLNYIKNSYKQMMSFFNSEYDFARVSTELTNESARLIDLNEKVFNQIIEKSVANNYNFSKDKKQVYKIAKSLLYANYYYYLFINVMQQEAILIDDFVKQIKRQTTILLKVAYSSKVNKNEFDYKQDISKVIQELNADKLTHKIKLDSAINVINSFGNSPKNSKLQDNVFNAEKYTIDLLDIDETISMLKIIVNNFNILLFKHEIFNEREYKYNRVHLDDLCKILNLCPDNSCYKDIAKHIPRLINAVAQRYAERIAEEKLSPPKAQANKKRRKKKRKTKKKHVIIPKNPKNKPVKLDLPSPTLSTKNLPISRPKVTAQPKVNKKKSKLKRTQKAKFVPVKTVPAAAAAIKPESKKGKKYVPSKSPGLITGNFKQKTNFRLKHVDNIILSDTEKELLLIFKNCYIVNQTFIIGGFPRDKLLTKLGIRTIERNDIDLITELKFKDAINLFPPGTVYISAFRKYCYTIRFAGQNIDVMHYELLDNSVIAKHADLTINSFLINYEGKVFDPLNHYADLKLKNIKPQNKLLIKTDPVRILRCIRIAFHTEKIIDENTLELLKARTKDSLPNINFGLYLSNIKYFFLRGNAALNFDKFIDLSDKYCPSIKKNFSLLSIIMPFLGENYVLKLTKDLYLYNFIKTKISSLDSEKLKCPEAYIIACFIIALPACKCSDISNFFKESKSYNNLVSFNGILEEYLSSFKAELNEQKTRIQLRP